MLPSSVYPELCLKYDAKGQLVCIMIKHADDLKIAGVPHIARESLMELQKSFGEPKVLTNSFLNCGAQHTQDPRTLPSARIIMSHSCVVLPTHSWVRARLKTLQCQNYTSCTCPILGAVV